jgi:hypothetical protein
MVAVRGAAFGYQRHGGSVQEMLEQSASVLVAK